MASFSSPLLLALILSLSLLALMDPLEAARRKKPKEEDRPRDRQTLDKVEELEQKKQQRKEDDKKDSEEAAPPPSGTARAKREPHPHRQHRQAVHEVEEPKGEHLDEEAARKVVAEGLSQSASRKAGLGPKDRPLPLPLPDVKVDDNLAKAMRCASGEE